jgi:hypothetical protein
LGWTSQSTLVCPTGRHWGREKRSEKEMKERERERESKRERERESILHLKKAQDERYLVDPRISG